MHAMLAWAARVGPWHPSLDHTGPRLAGELPYRPSWESLRHGCAAGDADGRRACGTREARCSWCCWWARRRVPFASSHLPSIVAFHASAGRHHGHLGTGLVAELVQGACNPAQPCIHLLRPCHPRHLPPAPSRPLSSRARCSRGALLLANHLLVLGVGVDRQNSLMVPGRSRTGPRRVDHALPVAAPQHGHFQQARILGGHHPVPASVVSTSADAVSTVRGCGAGGQECSRSRAVRSSCHLPFP